MNLRIWTRSLFLGGLVSLLAVLCLAPASAGESLDKPATPSAATDHKVYDVEIKHDLTYTDGAEADLKKHKLDLYLPKGKTDFPVVMFVHGGGWVFGDKVFFGVHEGVGKMFARHGIGAVVTNYRLSPGVKHPEHIKDVARAFAWTHQHIAEFGGRPDELFLCGHSAGGQLVSLLATDESYLKAEGLSLKNIKGVMPISGVYSIPDGLFSEVFGKDANERKNAGPMSHVHENCPPFLILYADNDFPYCDAMSEEFAKALRAKKVVVETLKIKDRSHLSIIAKAVKDDDSSGNALLNFVAFHQGKE